MVRNTHAWSYDGAGRGTGGGARRGPGGVSIALAGRGHSGHPVYLPPFFAFPPESARSPACFSSKSIQITGLAKFLFQNVFLVSSAIPSRLKKCKKIDRRVCEVSGQCQRSGHYGCSTTRFRLGWLAKLCFSDTIVRSASSICRWSVSVVGVRDFTCAVDNLRLTYGPKGVGSEVK